MPLDWKTVEKRYAKGMQVPTVAGNKTLEVVGADKNSITIRNPLWTAMINRTDLEKGVTLIEEGVISRDPGFFVEDYRVYVTDERATSVAHILRDLGFLDADTGMGPRC